LYYYKDINNNMSKARQMARLIDSNGDIVTAALDNILAGAPAALDTLDELAAALNDNPNIATVLEDDATASAIALG
jgi:hypothetical protein